MNFVQVNKHDYSILKRETMKKTLTLLGIAICSMVYGQSKDYYQKMVKNIPLFESSKTVADFQVLANTFVVISKSEIKEWLPLYYAGFATIFMAQNETEDGKVDIYLDQAQKYLDMASQIKSDESEILVLQGFLHQTRIKVSPMGRGQKYSTLANEVFAKAIALNPENPRIYYLQAQNVYNTPKMFGGGKKNALPLFQKADEKFKKFIQVSEISPKWGNKSNQELLSLCIQ